MAGSVGKEVGHFYPDVVVKNELDPDNLSLRSVNNEVKDNMLCDVKDEVGVAAIQGSIVPKHEHLSITTDLVVKIKKENKELVGYHNNSPECTKQDSGHEVKRENDCKDRNDDSFFNDSFGNSSDNSAGSAVESDDQTMGKADGKKPNISQTQQTNSRISCSVKIFDVSVQLQDLFPSFVRKLGKAHSNDKPCPCMFCRGEYRFSSYFGESRKHGKNETGLIHSSNFSPNIKTWSECEQHLNSKMSESRCSNEVPVKLHNYSVKSKLRSQSNEHKRDGCVRTVFSCTECSVKIEGRSRFEDHLRVHSGERCKLCPAKFKQRGNLKGHRMRVHSNTRPFECKQCPAKFVTRSPLLNHSRIHSGEKPFECPQCHRKFTLKQNMRSHIKRMHSHVKPFKCAQCPAAFKQKYELQLHLRVHTGEKPFQCEQCPLRFSQSANLKTHAKVHSIDKPFICAQCPSKFRSKDALRCHLRTHSNERPFSCAECTLKFKSKHELKRHIVGIHVITEKPFECMQCSAQFKRISYLRHHSKVVHSDSRPFKCKQCPSTFKLSSTLCLHLRRHSNVRPFKCDECRAAFKSKYDLVVHVRIHTGERPFKCQHCPASFTRRCPLSKHLSVHTGDRPFKCKQCSASFVQNVRLKVHLKKMHSCKL